MVVKKTFSGKTLDEALEAATRAYRKPREEIEYRVLVEKKSLFGLAKMVTVEVIETEFPPVIRTILNKIIVGMGLSLSYEIDADDESLQIELTGDDLGLVLHRNGELLDAIQTLVIQATKQEDWDQRVVVDADGFREKLRAKLQRMARQTANRVKKEGRPRKLEPLPPHLRKIVHLSLSKSRDVVTHSEGNGYFKQVIISPQDR
ncbi:MAG TPA: R3H domain-containing nucleic acid-binding protein [Thermoanaerobaculia bacterium]|nr:R3H domain-containing nucleic acid-binding protein [Thermoanaerobaculia bacterium]HUM29166.1 R3H domain-containing nucleic acid-binding protein [Thermoanaerobaculia bacterium]HXK67544.1 R3H domain-containing nucleic acid-binding protein [Thermoanaerobaculia bacterium]